MSESRDRLLNNYVYYCNNINLLFRLAFYFVSYGFQDTLGCVGVNQHSLDEHFDVEHFETG